MLRTLSIQNLAVIEDAQIDLLEGLNVFTGATGAGKSLVIGALELLLGLRASSDMVRAGADEARVSALFEIADDDLRRELQAAIDLALDDDQLLIQRRVSASGGSRASLNGQPITAGMLRRLSQTLVDIHGQYDQQYLLQPSNQLDVLDAFGKLHDRRVAYRKVFEAHRDALQRKADLETGRDLRRQQLELYEFQAAEIDQADIRPGEIEELESRRRRLTGAERLTTNLSLAYDGLYESEGSITDRLKALVHLLDELSELDESLQAPANAARESAFALDDLAFQLRRAAERVEADPQALAETEDRLHALKRLADKYGPSEAEILALREDLRSKIAELRAQEDDRDHLDAELESLSRQMLDLGRALSDARVKVAAKLQKKIETELRQLEMKSARLEVAVRPSEDDQGRSVPTATGLDEVEFLFAPNPGEPPKPLRKIASGGELSRVMLALKGVLAQSDRISVLVFDEIDGNVGGRLGAVIGRKLAALADHHQVLCITHLPQIASFGRRQLTVRKETRDGRSFTRVEPLDGDRRVAELAEMISGRQVTETTLRQAREMLQAAGQ
ncbi:MAG TPA: DNA repair protein RecN [Phycisphaerae bacterium]|nr:DNA repair protein RecN [Phycisphaerae bacterium]HOI54261.1 DNA repair protein RecN [Phycisphaerae bacterium]